MIAREPIRTGLPVRTGEAGAFDREVGRVISDPHLVRALHRSISAATLRPHTVRLVGSNPIEVFRYSLEATIAKILTRERRMKLLEGLLRYAPDTYYDLEAGAALTKEECESCINFIYYSMVNRFQGELAELLALEPVMELMDDFKSQGLVRDDVLLYWGEVIQERTWTIRLGRPGRWAKGADGLIATRAENEICLRGAVEVKSMRLPPATITSQIERHLSRTRYGLRINGEEILSGQIRSGPPTAGEVHRIVVIPSNWKLSRHWERVLNQSGDHSIRYPERDSDVSPEQRPVLSSSGNTHVITLGWSEEALAEAAYEMTFWYMREVGKRTYRDQGGKPKDWDMTAEEAGQNAIKAALYYLKPNRIELKKIN